MVSSSGRSSQAGVAAPGQVRGDHRRFLLGDVLGDRVQIGCFGDVNWFDAEHEVSHHAPIMVRS